MSDFAWWQRGIVYQIYPRSFKDSNGDGIGDIQGIIDKLDYLNDGTTDSLGVDAIWISPFYPSPMADFGYDVANYVDVDPMFGDLETFDRLIAEAHRRNMKIIIDYVPNHTSDQHPWFIESRSSRDNPKRDWYIWKDAKADGSPPNNWGGVFGGSAWQWDEVTQQYFFHQFDPAQPDLNWRNPEVKAAMLDVLRFWMKRGVDGFRMDVVYMIWKHPDMPDHPVIEGATGRNENDIIGRQDSSKNAFNYEGVHDVMREIRSTLDEHNAIGIAEIWLPLEERMKYYGANMDEFHMPFTFDFIGDRERYLWDADFVRRTVEHYEKVLPEGGWPNYVLGNHDIPRLASRYGSEDRARVAAMLLLTLRGTPTLYMGDEIGMVNGNIPEDQVQDPQGKVLGVAYTRDVCRTPMQWDNSTSAGFGSAQPWLPVNKDYTTRNVAAQQPNQRSTLTLYRSLIWYRKQHDSLAVGSIRFLDAPQGVLMYLREYQAEKHLIILNYTDHVQTISTPESGTIILSTTLMRRGDIYKTGVIGANEGLLIKLN